MSRRIEVELTSARQDGTWTWRAAGAREPRGVLDGNLLPGGAKVGDVLRADADFDVDGITVTSVLAPKGARKEPARIELLAGASSFEPVTQTLVANRDRPRREGERGEGRPRREGDRGGPGADRGRARPRTERTDRGDRPGRPAATATATDRPPRPEGASERPRREPRDRPPRPERPSRPPVPELPMRPKPKRLRAVRSHRNAILASLPPEEKAVAEQVLKGGVPAVRQALEEQNAQLRAEGKPELPPAGVVRLAEDMLPRLRVAEWLDRAEGALKDLDELDLRDLRSVVVASDDPAVARDETTREMAARLKDGLANRQDKEHQDWLADIAAALAVGRVVRALRLSSRPPKAGVRFPPELAARLGQTSLASLTADASSDRWVAVLEALAYSPVHATVVPAGVPDPASEELRATVKRLAGLVPEVAKLFGIEPPAPGGRAPRPPRRPPPRKSDKPKLVPPPPPADTVRVVPAVPVAPAEAEPVVAAVDITDAQPIAEGDVVVDAADIAPTATAVDDVTESEPIVAVAELPTEAEPTAQGDDHAADIAQTATAVDDVTESGSGPDPA